MHDTYQELEKTRSYEVIVEQFVKLIASGQLKPGEQLLPERELATKFSVSRTILREAFRVLESMGLIESRIGSGRYIRTTDPGALEALDLREGQEHLALYLSFLEARKYIEMGTVELAALRATPEDLERIRQTVDVELTETNFIKVDTAYHLALSMGAHNSVLERIMGSQLFTIYFTGIWGSHTPSQRWNEISREHRAIFEAIKAHDPEKAKTMMLTHLNNVRDNILRLSR